jgi:plastocyanin
VLLLKYRSVPWGLTEGGRSRGARSDKQKKSKNRYREYAGGGHIVKRLIYVIPLTAIAVLVFAALAVAQDVPQGQAEGQDPSQNETDINTATDTNSTSVQKRTTTRTTSSSTTTVDITDDAFDPSELNIAAGTTVTFVNNGAGLHTATADNGLFDSGELAPGSSYPVVLEGAGTVTYHDELNPDMTGSITVG